MLRNNNQRRHNNNRNYNQKRGNNGSRGQFSILPPAHILEQYESLAPGAAEKIIDMVDVEQDHRQRFENRSLTAYIINYRIGQFLASVNLVIIFYAGFYAYDKLANPTLCYAIIGAGFLLQFIFILSNKSRKRFAERSRNYSKK